MYILVTVTNDVTLPVLQCQYDCRLTRNYSGLRRFLQKRAAELVLHCNILSTALRVHTECGMRRCALGHILASALQMLLLLLLQH